MASTARPTPKPIESGTERPDTADVRAGTRLKTMASTKLQKLARSRLYVLVDGRESIDAFATLVSSLVSAGVGLIQLRDNRLTDRQILARAQELRRATAGSDTLSIVNNRPDVAKLAQVDGVHVGQEDLAVPDVRCLVGSDTLVGVSTHSLEQALQAVRDRADLIGVGPTFPSMTKDFSAFAGLDTLKAVGAQIDLPAFAIGGIDRGNLDQVLTTPITRIAVSAAVTQAPDPAAAAVDLMQLLGKSIPRSDRSDRSD